MSTPNLGFVTVTHMSTGWIMPETAGKRKLLNNETFVWKISER
jgi:hypothetical protein